ncbi:MAG: outer membrane lipoprotein-sorting protein [Bacteroidales bacterium]|nr:outer membrane lipoprotein-sorting protein [Bacteroidales bacterium]
MKTLISITISVLLTISVTAQEMTSSQILNLVEENEEINSTESKGRQTITTSKGKKRTLEMTSYSKGNGKSQLSVYTSPARVAGDKILMLNDGDDIWFYTPKTDRVRHLASHAKKQKVQGSDFSYQDMEKRNYEKDFSSSLLGTEEIKGNVCYKIELVPTETGPDYSKMIIWVDKDKFAIRQVDYYEEGELLKRLSVENIKQIKQYWVPMKYTMTNLQDGGFTMMETLDMEVDVQLDDKMFTTNYLKQK